MWGGRFQAMTCSPFSTFDTVIWAGLGCPVDAPAYRCQQGNDDNGAVCNSVDFPGSSSLHSAAVLSPLRGGTVVFVLVGSYSALPPAGGNYGYVYSYTGGSETQGTPSPTRSPASVTATPSGTPTPSITPTGSATPPATPTSSESVAETPSITPSASITGSIPGTPPGTPSTSRTSVPTIGS